METESGWMSSVKCQTFGSCKQISVRHSHRWGENW